MTFFSLLYKFIGLTVGLTPNWLGTTNKLDHADRKLGSGKEDGWISYPGIYRLVLPSIRLKVKTDVTNTRLPKMASKSWFDTRST